MEEKKEVIDWSTFKAFVTVVVEKYAEYLYRGHASDEWELISRFHRDAVHRNLALSTYWAEVIPEVYYRIVPFLGEEFNLESKEGMLAFLSVLQHHGFPTPLLDWTLSPYIAAYFAFTEVNDDQPQSDYVAIQILDFSLLERIHNTPLDLLSEEPYIAIVRPSARHNPRLVAQEGAFTITNVKVADDFIKSMQSDKEPPLLTVFRMSVKEKPLALRDLNLMRINEQTLFPGLDGACRRLRNLYFAPSEVGKTPTERSEEILQILEKLKKESK